MSWRALPLPESLRSEEKGGSEELEVGDNVAYQQTTGKNVAGEANGYLVSLPARLLITPLDQFLFLHSAGLHRSAFVGGRGSSFRKTVVREKKKRSERWVYIVVTTNDLFWKHCHLYLYKKIVITKDLLPLVVCSCLLPSCMLTFVDQAWKCHACRPSPTSCDMSTTLVDMSPILHVCQCASAPVCQCVPWCASVCQCAGETTPPWTPLLCEATVSEISLEEDNHCVFAFFLAGLNSFL